MSIVLDNLCHYCEQARAKCATGDDRKKVSMVNPKYSHHEEVDERLQFLKYLAQISPDY